ncbi:MAG: NAD(P)-binding protein, partial [Muribaculaceae bacterium]|nr:NAD(P)-binding protein [Muribaculaceae bacterium]
MSDNNKISEDRNSGWRSELRNAMPAKERTAIPRAVMPQLPPLFRVTCNDEVNMGLSHGQAVLEATRCLDCPSPTCVEGCPVGIDIPGFIKNIQRGDVRRAAEVLRRTSALPAVCGRVCPQERQCESRCIYHKMKKEPVAIGYLERYAADTDRMMRRDCDKAENISDPKGIKIAVAGSGPAGLSFAGEMARRGFEVEVFEALHEIGGVLKYGIPEFRLPNSVVDAELESLKAIGVKFHTDIVIGKTLNYDTLMAKGFKGLFVASGAGLPRFMGIP